MLIQRMAFIRRDVKAKTSQVLFLLRSGHDLEIDCQLQDANGKVLEEPVRLAFTLDDAQANRLDRFKRNTHESYDAWRRVLELLFVEGAVRHGGLNAEGMALVALSTIATFGEPCWQLDERIGVVDRNMTQVIRVHQRRDDNVNL